MGLFGMLYMTIMGFGAAGHSIKQSIRDDESRERAKRMGNKTYISSTGERSVETNNRIVCKTLPNGDFAHVDERTGKVYINFDAGERNRKERFREEFRQKAARAKEIAIAKGDVVYSGWYWKEGPYSNGGIPASVLRLVENDMPLRTNNYAVNVYGDIRDYNLDLYYKKPKEEYCKPPFNILIAFHAFDKDIKEINSTRLVNYIESYNLNEMLEYCKKYNIPIYEEEKIIEMLNEKYPLESWKDNNTKTKKLFW